MGSTPQKPYARRGRGEQAFVTCKNQIEGRSRGKDVFNISAYADQGTQTPEPVQVNGECVRCSQIHFVSCYYANAQRLVNKLGESETVAEEWSRGLIIGVTKISDNTET